jgi:hypothetical protein
LQYVQLRIVKELLSNASLRSTSRRPLTTIELFT